MRISKVLTILVCCFLVAGMMSFVYASSSKPAEAVYCQTKYPIILVHGVCGFDSIAGLVDYWYGVTGKLTDGGAKVKSAKLSAQSNNDVRANQLLTQIQAFLSETGAKKVNIIAHSHGSTTSRQAMYMRPDLVASLTTIAGPHKGSPVADFANEDIPPAIVELGSIAGNVLGKAIDLVSGNDGLSQDTAGLIKHFTKAGIAEFNRNYPSAGVPVLDDKVARGASSETFVRNGNSYPVRYYSWTGCKQLTNVLDVIDYLWPILHIINNYYGMNEDDGFVGVNGSHFGEVISDSFEWNHADEVNHLLGIRKPFSTDPTTVIREHANRLKLAGY
jgi:triacylglycerol lipase